VWYTVLAVALDSANYGYMQAHGDKYPPCVPAIALTALQEVTPPCGIVKGRGGCIFSCSKNLHRQLLFAPQKA
jgi:hypothetical protein